MNRFLETSLRFLFLLSAVWSIGAGIWILLEPQTIHEIEASAVNGGASGGTSEVKETTRQVSFTQIQGAWGVFILVIFASLTCAAAWLYLRGRALPATVLALLMLAFTYLSGFSIGVYYLPSTVALLIGAALWFWRRRLSSSGTGS